MGNTGTGAIFPFCFRRVVPDATLAAGAQWCFSYNWDGNNNRTQITWPDGPAEVYAYDAYNRVSNITYWYLAAANYAYDGLSRVKTITRSNGTSTAYAYNDSNDLTSLTHTFAGGSSPATIGYALGADSDGKLVSSTATPSTMEWAPTTAYASTYGPVNNLNQWPAPEG